MRKSFFGIVILLFLLISRVLLSQNFYVDPNGNDTNPGTLEQPLQTFQGALEALKNSGGSGIVYFRGGRYVFDKSVVINNEYVSGGATFRAYNDEKVIFTSLEKVSGWTNYSGNIMVADLPEGVDHIRYLQDASENWMPRSATDYFEPAQEADLCNEAPMYEKNYAGLSDIQKYKTFVSYPASWNQPDWSNAEQYDLRYASAAWSVNVLPISSVNSGENRINVTTPATYVMLNPSGDCSENQGWVLNTIAGIDSPGEWASINGKIYLYPKSGTDDIYIPQTEEFIRVDAGGDGNTWNGTAVSNIIFDGITFTGGDFYIRQYDYDNPQNSDASTQHDWGLVDCPAAMLRFRNASNCEVRNCTITKSGGGGIRLDRYCQDIQITNNEFSYLGREAVSLTGRGIGYGDVNKNNEISSNKMVATGREKWDAPAINLSQSSNNYIHHNYIEDTHLSAIIATSSRSVYIGFKSYEDSDQYFIGSECHYWEVKPEVVDLSDDQETYGYEEAKIETHKYMYNYNNVIEKNVITDAHNGGKFFHVDNILPTNGIVYISGATYDETNYLRQNYFVNCDPQPNTQLLYADTYMDHIHVKQNMIYDVEIGNGPGEDYTLMDVFCNWQDWDVQHGNQQGYVNVNVARSSSFHEFVFGYFINTEGNINFDREYSQGSPEYLDDYKEMYSLLNAGELPGQDTLPGVAILKEELNSEIEAIESDTVRTGWNKVNDNARNASYSGDWQSVSAEGGYQNDAHWTEDENASMTFDFNGTQLRIYVWKFDFSQTFNISIDNGQVQTVTLEAGDKQSVMVFESETLSSGDHRAEISYVSGEVHIDAFAYYNEETTIDKEKNLPQKFVLYHNYPNPFNPETKIKFALPESGRITLDVYNILGEKVITLLDKNMNAGYHSTTFDAADLASGVYYYRLEADDYIASKKCILLK